MDRQKTESVLQKLSVAATIGMFLVVLMGATVTNTGSQEGCGDHWPLCHGEFIPSYSLKTAIEYSHRFVTGIEGILIMGTAIGALKLRGGRRDVRVYVGLMVGTLFLQAGMGAWAVKRTQDAGVLALHFGFALICLASTYLVMTTIRERRDMRSSRRVSVPGNFAWLARGSIIAVYGVAYLGAYVRHAGAELACGKEWPLCNGSVLPGLNGAEGAHFAHRLTAFGASLVVVALVLWSRRFKAQRPDVYRGTVLAAGIIGAQAVAGAVVIFSELSIFSTLTHAALMALLFIALCDVTRRTVSWNLATAPAPVSVAHGGLPIPTGD